MISGEIGVKDVIGGSVAEKRAKQNVIQKFNEMIEIDAFTICTRFNW